MSAARRARVMADAPMAFGSAGFSPIAWVNRSLRADESDEPLDVRISVLLTKLQLQAADIEVTVGDMARSLSEAAPGVAADVKSAQEQTRAAHVELSALLDQAAVIESSSASAVRHIREVVEFQDRLSAASLMLKDAVQVSRALTAAERSFTRGESSAAASSLSEARMKLATPDANAARLLLDAPARAEALARKLEEGLRPALLEAICNQQPDEVMRHAATLQQLGHASAVRDCYVECAQGPIYEQWNSTSRGFGGNSKAVCTRVGDFLAMLSEKVRSELAWLSRAVGSGEASSLIASMLRNALSTLEQPIEGALLSCVEGGHIESINVSSCETLLASLQHALDRATSAAELVRDEFTLTSKAVLSDISRTSADAFQSNGDGQPEGTTVPLALLQEAFVAPFVAVQQRAASILAPILCSVDDKSPMTSPVSSQRETSERLRAIAASASTISPSMIEAQVSTVRRLMSFCGPLGARPLIRWADSFTADFLSKIRSAVLPVEAFCNSTEFLRPGGASIVVTNAADDDDSDEGEEAVWNSVDAVRAITRQTLRLLRSLHGLRLKLEQAREDMTSEVLRSAAAHLQKGLCSPVQRDAAERLSSDGAAHDFRSQFGTSTDAMKVLLREVQRLALCLLVAPIREAIDSMGSSEMKSDWSDGLPSMGCVDGEGAHADEAARAALLAFSATPKVTPLLFLE